MNSISVLGEVRADQTLTLTIPTDLPPGPVRVSVTFEPLAGEGISPRDFLKSEFFGDWADRDDVNSRGARDIA